MNTLVCQEQTDTERVIVTVAVVVCIHFVDNLRCFSLLLNLVAVFAGYECLSQTIRSKSGEFYDYQRASRESCIPRKSNCKKEMWSSSLISQERRVKVITMGTTPGKASLYRQKR